jgi:hypothetical protein
LKNSSIENQKSEIGNSLKFPGGHRRGVTPVPIPNTEVKLSTADGTAWVTVWESRSLPGLFFKGRYRKIAAFFLYAIAQALGWPETPIGGPAGACGLRDGRSPERSEQSHCMGNCVGE